MKVSAQIGELERLEEAGFVIVPAVYSAAACAELKAALERALAEPDAAPSLLLRNGGVYGARNLIDLCPAVAAVWRQSPLPGLLEAVLDTRFGLVRALYFDKHAETWSLPWHKDMTIAVRTHRPSARFRKPTLKAGVPHVEAPQELLESMLILRLHLDDVTAANGPMIVLPGSHRTGKRLVIDESRRVSIQVSRGDVLAVRPLVAHASAASHAGNQQHRRVLHLEFAGRPDLPDDFEWRWFLPNFKRPR